jgi:hypothetical protein
MWVERLVTIVLPAAVMIVTIRWKLPDKWKKIFFALPIWITATILSWLVIGHIMAGVMAGPAILLCDLVLTPAFYFIQKSYEKKMEKEGRHPYEGIPWKQNYKGKKVVKLEVAQPEFLAA